MQAQESISLPEPVLKYRVEVLLLLLILQTKSPWIAGATSLRSSAGLTILA